MTAETQQQAPRFMAEPPANGETVIKISKKGRRKVQFGDGPVITVDVIHVHNQWSEIDRSFRNEKGEIPPEKTLQLAEAACDFVRKLVVASVTGLQITQLAELQQAVQADAGLAQVALDISDADVWDFLARMTEEAEALKPFFAVKSPATPSSRENTDVIFST